jgi:hypothetical protein
VTYVLEALKALWPNKHLQAWDNDGCPITLFETASMEHFAMPHELGGANDPPAGFAPRVGCILISELYHNANAGIIIFPADCPERPLPDNMVNADPRP